MTFLKHIYAMWLAWRTPGYCWRHAKPAVKVWYKGRGGHTRLVHDPGELCRYFPHKYKPICETCLKVMLDSDQMNREHASARERRRERRIAKLERLNRSR